MIESHHFIGATFSSELREFRDPETGRRVTQLTNARGHSYPLYFFVSSITSDGRHLVFHSERSGWVQLYRLDLESGEIGQLTDGRTCDSGWAIWCERHLRGIYNHLSALDPVHNEVFYFQDDELRATHVQTFANRLVAKMPRGRVCIGQNAFSNDGSLFAFIHADAARFNSMIADREALVNMGLFDWTRDHSNFRNSIGGVTLAIIETATGKYREVITTNFHFHHVLFLDDTTFLLNHPKDCNGMWAVTIDGTNVRHIRPHTDIKAHGAQACHQVVTANGILYEANAYDGDQKNTYLGRYDTKTDSFQEILLPLEGYVHTGNDPAGRFAFIEYAGTPHQIMSVHFPTNPARLTLKTIRKLAPARGGQRNHAHPFLTPDRQWIVFTDSSENGFNQIYRVHVEDLVEANEGWATTQH